MIWRPLLIVMPLVLASQALAQPMDHPSMPGMSMPMPGAKPSTKPAGPTKAKPKPKSKPAASAPEVGGNPSAAAAADAHAGHDMSTMPATATSASGVTAAGAPAMAAMPGIKSAPPTGAAQSTAGEHDMAAMPGMVEAEIPNTPPPAAPMDHAADRYFDAGAMAAARSALREEHGGTVVSKVMANLAEYQARSGRNGYRWVGQAWIGGDINRFVLKTEGEGAVARRADNAEVQALYSRAVGAYTDVQVGLRQDIEPTGRTYATIGVETLAPYWIDVEGALFLSTKGEVLARVESAYDLRLTQRLILQPRAELNLAAQNTAETRTGSGISNAELGLRLRYEVKREFAPYIGVSYDRKFGKTGDYARALGEPIHASAFVVGVRTWF